jgi:hypothetical protein
MITWNVSAQFLRHINLAKVEIPLHSFLNGFRILESKIENDTLILQFASKDHFFVLDKEANRSKMSADIKTSHHEIE